MSMYTQLLTAAYDQQPVREVREDRVDAVAEVLRCRDELDGGAPPGLDPDAVPVMLSLQIGYDVALLKLARVLDIESGPDRFEQPQLERRRLEAALGEHGIDLGRSDEVEPEGEDAAGDVPSVADPAEAAT